ncbi:DUF4132 domain-containing protein [Paenibacillus sp. WLX2291]|uniref:DUF4132 domain-containing protein n=1 Tax=Paenibacillus sp. WLX2291 TaxID=3296934 RepID=UPI0039840035
MMLNQTSIDPLLENFARHCSEEYSKLTDRKQEILDYITGATDTKPDMMKNSNQYAYKTFESLNKLSKKEHNDAFYRAVALVLHTSSNWDGYYYNNWYIFELCMRSSITLLTLASRTQSWEQVEREGRSALQGIARYAGHEIIEKAIAFLLSNSDLNRPSSSVFKQKGNQVARIDYAVQLLLLLHLYRELDEKHVQKISKQLPPLLEYAVAHDSKKLNRELQQTLQSILPVRLSNSNMTSDLDLDADFLQSQREEEWTRRFPSSQPSKQMIKSDQIYRELVYVHTAFFYTLTLHGGKKNLLEHPDDIAEQLLDAIRGLHEVLPIETRQYLTQLSNRNVDTSTLVDGIVSLDKPYGLIEMIRNELNNYSTSWNTLRNTIAANPQVSEHAMAISRNAATRALIFKVLLDAGHVQSPNGSAQLEQLVLQTLEDRLDSNKAGHTLASYVKGDLDIAAVHTNDHVRALWNKDQRNSRASQILLAISYLPVRSELFRRFLIAITQPDIPLLNVLSILYKSPFFKGSEVLNVYSDDAEIDTDELLASMLQLQGRPEYYYISIPTSEYSAIVRAHMLQSMQQYSKLPLDGRTLVLETIYDAYEQLDMKQRAEALRIGLGDSSKKINARARAEFARHVDSELYTTVYSQEKKAAVKEWILDSLRSLNDAGAIYANLLKKEKSQSFRDLIEVLMNTADQPPQVAHAAIASKTDAKKLSRIQWLPVDLLPQLQTTDGSPLDDNIKRYLLLQSLDFTASPNERLHEVKQYASPQSLADFAFELVQLWMQQGAPAKEKWILYLAAMFGDRRLINMLGGQIKDWTENSRGAIAAEAVRVLAYLNDTAALMLIEQLSRTIKNRQVKAAAAESLHLAAENMNLTPEQLADRLVTTLGLDSKGELELSYGERAFTVKVNSDLQLSVINQENGKIVKSLPAASQKDDEALVKQSKSMFTQLKKDLKTMVTLQTQRLEESLSKRRLWTTDEWNDLFVHNIIMRQFAVSLIWGVYTNGELTATFRYMEDGTFNTVDEDEYELEQDAQIGLVHPLELEPQLLADWKTQLEDYEVVQPFTQLDRRIYSLEEEELQRREWTAVPSGEYSPTGFPKAMERYGWFKGEAQDAGFYYELYKQYDHLIAELRFSGTSISYYEGMEDISLEELRFYKNDQQDQRHRYYSPDKSSLLVDVPDRVFSETVYDILRAAGEID